jgi:hypothetical protein
VPLGTGRKRGLFHDYQEEQAPKLPEKHARVVDTRFGEPIWLGAGPVLPLTGAGSEASWDRRSVRHPAPCYADPCPRSPCFVIPSEVRNLQPLCLAPHFSIDHFPGDARILNLGIPVSKAPPLLFLFLRCLNGLFRFLKKLLQTICHEFTPGRVIEPSQRKVREHRSCR